MLLIVTSVNFLGVLLLAQLRDRPAVDLMLPMISPQGGWGVFYHSGIFSIVGGLLAPRNRLAIVVVVVVVAVVVVLVLVAIKGSRTGER